ncbi:hypothetical protein M426DRAFT_133951 [Hypoxylon sp. CI-4A]|nr:hypothetical protein M426DRAFT_133951 [Hypoxylon sp. CI-4A]
MARAYVITKIVATAERTIPTLFGVVQGPGREFWISCFPNRLMIFLDLIICSIHVCTNYKRHRSRKNVIHLEFYFYGGSCFLMSDIGTYVGC